MHIVASLLKCITSLKGRYENEPHKPFLVAMPGMKDPYFQNSVIYVCEHNEEGAMGLMINAPVDITVGNMLKQVDVQPVHRACLKPA